MVSHSMTDTPVNENGKSLLFTFRFPDSGREVTVRKLPFFYERTFMAQYAKDHPAPQPPTTLVDYGDGDKVVEPNTSHPVYYQRLARWEKERDEWVDSRIKHLYADFALHSPVDKAAVDKVREQMALLDTPLDGLNDAYVYLWMVCVATLSDFTDFIKFMRERTAPTEETIALARESFPGTVQG